MDEQVASIRQIADTANLAARCKRVGCEKEWEHCFEPHLPWFVWVAKGTVRIYLSEHSGNARPGVPVYLGVRDVPAIANGFQIEVHEQPWAREIRRQDPDVKGLLIGTTKA